MVDDPNQSFPSQTVPQVTPLQRFATPLPLEIHEVLLAPLQRR